MLIFFVLSGFLITWLLLKENDKYQSVSLKQFYIRRSLRIFPAFYVFWVCFVVDVQLTHSAAPWGFYVSAFFYVSDYYRAFVAPPVNSMGHTWSLAIEEQFYLLWPVLFVAFRNNLPRLAKILGGIIVAIWVQRAVRCCFLGVTSEYIYHAFDTRLDSLLAGCLLAVMLRAGIWAKFWAVVCRRWFNPLLPLALLVSSMIVTGHSTRYRDVVGLAVDPLLVAVLIAQMIALHDRPVWSALNWGWMQYLGRISYPLYLYHPLTFKIVQDCFPDMRYRYKAPLGYALTIAAASVSYLGVERYFLALKKKHARV